MSLVPSSATRREDVAVSASGASVHPPPQPQTANDGTSCQPEQGPENAKRMRQEHPTAKVTSSPTFPQLSASTEAVLKRVGKGSSAWDMAREIVLKGMITTQTIPTPQPTTRGSRRGGRGSSRGGRVLPTSAPTNGATNASVTATPNSTPVSSSGSSRGRGSGRGRGRGGGRPSKRRRASSEDSEVCTPPMFHRLSKESVLRVQNGPDNTLVQRVRIYLHPTHHWQLLQSPVAVFRNLLNFLLRNLRHHPLVPNGNVAAIEYLSQACARNAGGVTAQPATRLCFATDAILLTINTATTHQSPARS